jgi:hypothetical protein
MLPLLVAVEAALAKGENARGTRAPSLWAFLVILHIIIIIIIRVASDCRAACFTSTWGRSELIAFVLRVWASFASTPEKR